ncbi:tetratricopeptide repeat protein [bacterium]|nr:tetratricopeptide repeat protein [bacterium]
MDQHLKAIADYEIVAPLGRGGMGVVYRCRHRRTGEHVALKTVLLNDQKLLESIRREIRVLSRLDHPGIVRIMDEGVFRGAPWYAMELLTGVTMRNYFNSGADYQAACQTQVTRVRGEMVKGNAATGLGPSPLWWTWSLVGLEQKGWQDTAETVAIQGPTVAIRPIAPASFSAERLTASPLHPADLAQVLPLFGRLCEPLAYMHGEGIVHRDLKPDNVIIRPDGQPVLVDFGLMRFVTGRQSRESLAIEQGAVGTMNYIAPEQISGQQVDARADLYSLGCMLYELVFGLPVFLNQEDSQLLKARQLIPPGPSWTQKPEFLSEFDELMSRLLAKDPRERLGYADMVAASISRWCSDFKPWSRGPKPKAYLYHPGFTGRDSVLQRIRKSMAKLSQNRGAFVLIRGERGLGKTRLLMEIGQQAARQSCFILTGECLDTSTYPLQALQRPMQIIADLCRQRGQEEIERILGKQGRLLSIYFQSLASLPGVLDLPEPVDLPANEARSRLFHALMEVLSRLAHQKPLLLLIDDLHRADDLFFGFLQYLVRDQTLRKLPLLCLATCHSESVSPEIETLVTSPGVKNITLKSLNVPAISRIISDMLALKSPARSLCRHLARHSEGNPFYLAEYLHLSVEQGLFWRNESGQWQIRETGPQEHAAAQFAGLPLPSSLRDIIEQRLHGLPTLGLQLVKAASLFEREIDVPLLTALTGLDHETVSDGVKELQWRRVLDKTRSNDCFAFVYGKFREVAYSLIEDHERIGLHFKAAQTLDQYYPDHNLADIGFHWERAGHYDQAIACYLKAARLAVKQSALAEAEKLYSACLALLSTPSEERVTIRYELGTHVLHPLAKNQVALDQLELAMADARASGYESGLAQCQHSLATIMVVTGRLNEAIIQLEQALELALKIGDLRVEGSIRTSLGVAHHHLGQDDRAAEQYLQALLTAQKTGERGTEGSLLCNLAVYHKNLGRFEEALNLYQKALSIARELDNKTGQATTMGNMAIIYKNLGDYEQARSLYLDALDIARESGNRRAEALNLGNLASLYRDQGHYDQAKTFTEKARSIAQEIDDPRLENLLLTNLAQLLGFLGQVNKASRLFRQALDLARVIGDPRNEAYVLDLLATLERRTASDLEPAQAFLDQSRTIKLRLKNKLDLIDSLCRQGHLDLARTESARPRLEEARSMAHELDLDPMNKVWDSIHSLEQVQRAFEDGETRQVFRGDLVEKLPPGLRTWLKKKKFLPQR